MRQDGRQHPATLARCVTIWEMPGRKRKVGESVPRSSPHRSTRRAASRYSQRPSTATHPDSDKHELSPTLSVAGTAANHPAPPPVRDEEANRWPRGTFVGRDGLVCVWLPQPGTVLRFSRCAQRPAVPTKRSKIPLRPSEDVVSRRTGLRIHSPLRGAAVGSDNWVPFRRRSGAGSQAAGVFRRDRAAAGGAEGAQLCWRAARRHRFRLDRSRPCLSLVPEPPAG